METPIQHVSDTAFWVAAYRMLESERPDALFHDPLAKVLAGEQGEMIAKRMGNHQAMAWSISLRTHMIDDYIQKALMNGVELVLNLGTGLDTRPYRLNLPPTLTWVEADFPQIIDFKESRLKNEKPRCQLERHKIDLSVTAAREAFLAEINSRGKKTLTLTEGVVPYLSEEDVAALANNLAAQSNFRLWITDYFSPFFMELHRKGKIGSRLLQNAPFRFSPRNWEQFFRENGWTLREMRYTSIEGKKLGRKPPIPFLMRLLMPLFPASQKQKFAKMTGYALLEKRSS